MAWTTLELIYGGIIGKTLFTLCTISLVAMIPYGQDVISSTWTSLSIIGAITISISFLIEKTFVPETIKLYNSKTVFYDHIISLHKQELLNVESEFCYMFDDKRKLLRLKSIPTLDSSEDIHSLDKMKDVIKPEKRLIYTLSTMKYEYENNSCTMARNVLALSIVTGTLLLYLPSIHRVTEVLFRGFSK